jgi:hypothetical protein
MVKKRALVMMGLNFLLHNEGIEENKLPHQGQLYKRFSWENNIYSKTLYTHK